MRGLDSITDSMDMNLSKFWEMVKGIWEMVKPGALQPLGCKELDKSLQLNNNNDLPSLLLLIWGRVDVSSDSQKRQTAEKIPSGRVTSQGHSGNGEMPVTGTPGGGKSGPERTRD